MSLELKESDGGKTLEVHVSGTLVHEDYQRFVPEFERHLEQHHRLRVLFDMVDFHGWGQRALWDDVKFDVKHHSDIERLAMVGDKKWQKGMSLFCRPFTSAKIRYFDRAGIDDARKWLAKN